MSFMSVMPVLRAGNGPLYIQLKTLLGDAIRDDRLTDAEALPTERDLAEHYGISRLTVRKALDGLEQEGLLVRRRGVGTFVASRHAPMAMAASVFRDDIICAGQDLRQVDVAHVMGAVTADEAMIFGVAIGTRVVRLHRMRCQDDAPVAVERSVVLASCLGDGAVIEDSLYRTMQQVGKCPSRVLRRVRAVALPREEAEPLGVPTGSPGLYMERRGFLRDGRTVELTRAWYRADRADLVSETSVAGVRD